MTTREPSTSDKKKAGNGNGNTVIDNHESAKNVSNYVSGDATATSSNHKFDSK
jgi:hypothetical protein